MAIDSRQMKFDEKHTQLLDWANKLEGEGISAGTFRVGDVEKAFPGMFDACERMYHLISHGLLIHNLGDDGEETGTYSITDKGRNALIRVKPKLAAAAKATVAARDEPGEPGEDEDGEQDEQVHGEEEPTPVVRTASRTAKKSKKKTAKKSKIPGLRSMARKVVTAPIPKLTKKTSKRSNRHPDDPG